MIQEITEAVKAAVRSGSMCGASLGFVLPDGHWKDVCFGYQGVTAPYDGRSVVHGIFYDMASLSKVMGTTTRVLQIAAEGRLSLESPVVALLPEFPYPDSGITVADLLLHCSGLPAEIRNKEEWTKETITELLYQTKPEFLPGEKFVYSDVGFIWLGKIIETLDQMSLEDSFQKYIFRPCGMKHTSFYPGQAVCVPTEYTPKRGWICGEVHDRKGYLLGPCGSAGLFSTLEDTMRFTDLYLRESEMLFPRVWFESMKTRGCHGRTWGWSQEYGPGTLYHTGFTGTSMLIDWNRRVGMILLTNRIHPTRENTRFLEQRKEWNQIFMEKDL